MYAVSVASTMRSLINGLGLYPTFLSLYSPNVNARFITPVFLHAGIIHYILNMLAQLTSSAQVRHYAELNSIYSIFAQIEREMGSVGFLVLYFAAGIFG